MVMVAPSPPVQKPTYPAGAGLPDPPHANPTSTSKPRAIIRLIDVLLRMRFRLGECFISCLHLRSNYSSRANDVYDRFSLGDKNSTQLTPQESARSNIEFKGEDRHPETKDQPPATPDKAGFHSRYPRAT